MSCVCECFVNPMGEKTKCQYCQITEYYDKFKPYKCLRF